MSLSRAVLVLLLVAGAASPAAERIPIAEFAPSSGAFGAMDLSPDGTKVVGTRLVDGAPVVSVLDVEAKSSIGLMPGLVDGFIVSWCRFKSDSRLLCSYRGVDHEAGIPFAVTRLVGVDADRSRLKVLAQRGARASAQFQDRILHWLPDDPQHVLVQVDDEDGDVFPDVYKLDVYTGRTQRVMRQRDPVVQWVADRSGAVRFGYGYTQQKAIFVARDSADAGWRILSRFERFGGSPFGMLGFGVLPNILMVSVEHNGYDAIFEMDIGDQSDLQLLFAHPGADVSGEISWQESGAVVGFEFETDRPQRHFIDPQAKAVQAAIDRSLPQTWNTIIRQAMHGDRYLVAAESDTRPAVYYHFDLGTLKRLELGTANAALGARTLAPMRSIEIATPEGLKLPGYLTVPVATEPKNLPAVVLPHGGPNARDSWGYDPLVQLLASRGYAVIQVNFRGSTGYGAGWLNAGHQAWGTVMHDDITSAARWAIAQGIVDPERLCIVGWSYGGYAALIGAIKEPGLYRCAASIAGVTSLRQLQRDNEIFYGASAAVRNATGTEDLAENSPLKLVDGIRVPVLLVHGTDDLQVQVEHSRRMARALDGGKKPNELVLIEHGDHSLSRAAWRLTLYTKLAEFLERNLGPPAPSPGTGEGQGEGV